MIRVGVYRGPYANSSDEMTYRKASGEGIEFDFIMDKQITPLEVMARNYDILDLPDPLYDFTQAFSKEHPRTVITVWENLPWNMMEPHWKECFDRAALIVCRSPMAMQSAIEAGGADPDKCIVIPAGVDTDQFKPGVKIPGSVLYAGRIVWEKGIFDLLMAAKGQQWHLTVIGDGPHRPDALAFSECLGLTNVSFSGSSVSHDRMPAVYADQEVFVYPSIPTSGWVEQFGICVLEAAASGCKLILSHQAVFEWLRMNHMRMTRLVPPGDYMRLRSSINHALVDSRIPSKMWRHVFSSESVGKKLRKAYARLGMG